MKKELILKDWQKEIVKDKSRIIMMNTCREGSKTFLLANKVLEDKPKTVLYINDNPKGLRNFEKQFLEIFQLDDDIKESVEHFRFLGDEIYIKFVDGKTITIYDRHFEPEEDMEFDKALFDDGLPQLDIKAKQYVSVFTIKYPIMNLFNCRKDISYYVIGIKQLVESDYLTKKQLQHTRDYIGEANFSKWYDMCNEYNEIFEEKPVRGLRRFSNAIDEVCDMDKEELNKVLHKIDFVGAIKKKKETMDKKVQDFNSVIEANIDEIEKLFKSDCSEYVVRMSRDNKGYFKLTIKKTVLNGDKLYEFGHIEDRGDGHSIKEVTTNRLRNFVSDIYVKNNL